MTKAGLTEIAVVIDKSGSMGSIKDDAIGAFNEFLKAQKECPGEALMTVTLFDTQYDIIHKGKNIQDVPQLTTGTYQPSGMTALLDAIGKTIDDMGKRFSAMPEDERPEKVVFAIITDGAENSSKEYSRDQITKMIKTQTDEFSWEFVFLAAGLAAVNEATSIGIQMQNLVKFEAGNAHDYISNVRGFSANVSSYRQTGKTDWTNDNT